MIDQLSYRELWRLATTQFPNCFCGFLSIGRAGTALQLLDARMVCVLSGEIENVVVCRAAGVAARLRSAGTLARQFNDQVQRGRTPNEFAGADERTLPLTPRPTFEIRTNLMRSVAHIVLKEIDFAVVNECVLGR